jgi:hypothetical protein
MGIQPQPILAGFTYQPPPLDCRTEALKSFHDGLAPSGYEPRQFSTWAPLVLSGIGDLPDTVRACLVRAFLSRHGTARRMILNPRRGSRAHHRSKV